MSNGRRVLIGAALATAAVAFGLALFYGARRPADPLSTDALLDHLGIDSAVLLGTSSGGIIAYRFAAAYPARVRALILSNVPPSAPVDNAGVLSRLSPWLRWSLSTCLEQGRPWPKICWRDFLDSNFHRKSRVTDELVTEY